MTNPFLLKNMRKAVNRLILAKKRGEKIAVWGDYDPDGVCGAVLLYEALRKAGFKKENLYVSLPNTHQTGYGLTKKPLAMLKKIGIRLIITVDFGIAEIEGVKTAKKWGMEAVILDHHLPKKQYPQAIVVNPKQAGDRYAFKGFSGTGVAYKFAEALFRHLGERRKRKEKLKQLSDLAAIAVIADRMPLEKENKILLNRGLAMINRRPRPGLSALKHLFHLKKVTLNNIDLLINSLGAMRNTDFQNTAFKLLTAPKKSVGHFYALKLAADARKFEKLITGGLIEGLKKFRLETPLNVMIWRRDIDVASAMGELASRLVAIIKIPIFIYSKRGKVFKGSARASEGYDLVKALDTCPKIFVKYGGHKQAAGYEFKQSREKEFVKCLTNYFRRKSA
jgi:single-stranded-DNA-specific exonuclease